MGLPWYCVREDIANALDQLETARSNTDIDRRIDAVSREIDGVMHRRFYPQLDPRSFDWPNNQVAYPWRLWLDANELASLTQLSSGGVVIPLGNVKLYPDWGPPYKHLELDVSTSSTFNATSSWQKSITATGVFAGCRIDEIPAGALASSILSTDLTINPGVPGYRGVGSILRVDTERMIVTNRAMASTGVTLVGNLLAQMQGNLVGVANITAFAIGEVILIDGEKMKITDTAGTNLIVKRAWDGTPLATHTGGATIYANRLLTVTRGALGTTAAAHAQNAPILEFDPPALIRELCVAQVSVNLIQGRAGWPLPAGRKPPQGETNAKPGLPMSDLADLWDRAMTAHRRSARKRTV